MRDMRLAYIGYISVLLPSMVVFAGCMKVSVDHVIQPDGNSHATIVNDLSALAGLGDLNDASFGGLGDAAADPVATNQLKDFEKNLETVCDDFYRDTALLNPTCERKDYVVTMQGDVQLTEPAFTVKKSIPYVTYTYDAAQVLAVLSETGGKQADQFDTAALQQAKSGAALVGMELTYTVQMPGKEIVTTDVGDIKDTSVKINIFDLIDKDTTNIVSHKVNWVWISVLILIGLVFLIIGVSVFIMMMKKKRKVADATPGLATTNKPFHVTEPTATSSETKTSESEINIPPQA